MPQITSIEPQKKRKERFNIYLDGIFAFGVNQYILLEYNLTVGKNLRRDQINQILTKEETNNFLDWAARFLSFRPRSEKEISEYLARKISQKEQIKYHQAKESPLIAIVLGKLRKYHYINDQEFAKWWVSARERSNPKGALVLKAELAKKGIAKDIIDSVLADLPNQVNTAKKLIQKKIKLWQKLSPLEFKRKIYQYLAARGFDYETIRQTLVFLIKNR